jgi:hypothetical protein
VPRDPEGHTALQLRATTVQAAQPSRSALAPALPEQLRLADPGGSLDRDEPTTTRLRLPEGLIDHREFGVTLQKDGSRYPMAP